ncbi:MAG: hypothetical protein COA79_22165 [Planctomycetota bacterium]|nr:MAG: hypothetical protein COA79_22165 [Planctomycetota bacterium]
MKKLKTIIMLLCALFIFLTNNFADDAPKTNKIIDKPVRITKEYNIPGSITPPFEIIKVFRTIKTYFLNNIELEQVKRKAALKVKTYTIRSNLRVTCEKSIFSQIDPIIKNLMNKTYQNKSFVLNNGEKEKAVMVYYFKNQKAFELIKILRTKLKERLKKNYSIHYQATKNAMVFLYDTHTKDEVKADLMSLMHSLDLPNKKK